MLLYSELDVCSKSKDIDSAAPSSSLVLSRGNDGRCRG